MQDATVQSTPQMSQAPSVAPSSYVTAAPVAAPAQSYQQAAPVAYQVGTSYPQAVPQVSTSYQSAPTQYAPQSQPNYSVAAPAGAPVSNPWESAFNKVVGLLSSPVQSPFQGQPSTTTPQYAPANFGTQSYQAMPQSGMPTSYLNPAYSPNSSLISSMPLPAAEAQEVDRAIADYYNLSNETRQVHDAFGAEAPAILNNYALQLEGMLDSAVAWGMQANATLGGYASFAMEAINTLGGYANFAVNEHQENLAYNEILTNPDVLSDYTLKYFGPEGPYPVYENEAELGSRGYRTQPIGGGIAEFPAPPSAAGRQQPENFWGGFSETMARDPQNAWRILNHAQPGTVANKLFVME